jgi:hypothetical protein
MDAFSTHPEITNAQSLLKAASAGRMAPVLLRVHRINAPVLWVLELIGMIK